MQTTYKNIVLQIQKEIVQSTLKASAVLLEILREARTGIQLYDGSG